jgi:2-polyprenyl-3-methyl-5-hydroxy-6-metoxy-1,4-benzoquinol methylase
VFTNSCTELDECGSCGHVYTRRAPKGRILHLRYGSFNYWYEDKLHQGINTLQDRSQWQGFITARRGALERAGLLEKPAQRVFEIGCSEGMLLRALADDGHSVRGCEYNPEIAAAGRKQLGVDILAQGFQTVNEKPGSYDLIVSFHTIEHVDGLQAVFGKAVNMLNAEGAMLIEVPTGPEEYHNIDHLHFFTKQSLERLLKRFFHEVEIFDNSFTTAEGKVVGSLYGSGRFPRTEAGKTAAGTTTAAGGSCCSR